MKTPSIRPISRRKNPYAGRVECGRPDVFGIRSKHGCQAVAQLPCRFVCKRDGNDAPGCSRLARTQCARCLRHPLVRADPHSALKTQPVLPKGFPVSHRFPKPLPYGSGLKSVDNHSRFPRSLRRPESATVPSVVITARRCSGFRCEKSAAIIRRLTSRYRCR